MPRYRNKTAEVDAVQWTGNNADELRTFAGLAFDEIPPEDRVEDPEATAQVCDDNAWKLLHVGDWVIRRGEDFERWRADDFSKLYEPADSSPPSLYGQLADRLDAESARRVKAAWSPEEAVAAREWGNVAAYVRGLATDPDHTTPDDPGIALANHIFAQPLSVVQSALRHLGWPIDFEIVEERPRG